MEDQKIFCLLENVGEGECDLYEKWLQNVSISFLVLVKSEKCIKIIYCY